MSKIHLDEVVGRRTQDSIPFVSVIVVVRNEEANIARCLSRLVGQDYPHDRLEIIVVDGMSSDRTREIATSFQSGDIPLRILVNPRKGRTQGLNVAVRAARGEIIARVDGRTVIGGDYLSGCVKSLLERGADNAGGVQRPLMLDDSGPDLRSTSPGECRDPSDAITREAIAIVLSHPFAVGGAKFRKGLRSEFVDTVYLGCFRREVFTRVGMFDEDAPIISEDADINYRINRAGGKVYLNRNIVAHYVPRERLRDLWQLYVRYGGGKAGFLLKHHRLPAVRQGALAAFVGALVGFGIASVFSRLSFEIFLSLLGAYSIVNVAVSASIAMVRRKLGLFPRLAVAFVCVHFGWGCGFLRRLVQRTKPGEHWKH